VLVTPVINGNNGAFVDMYINSGISLKGCVFNGGTVINYDTLDGATIMYNTFRNHTAALNGDVAQNNLLHIGNLTNSTVKYNTFYNDMPPSSVDINPDHSGSDPDYGSGNPKTLPMDQELRDQQQYRLQHFRPVPGGY
jgi:hypothetical protein